MSTWSKLTSSSTSSNKWATSLKSLHNANEGSDASPTFIALRILNVSYERTIYIYIYINIWNLARIIVKNFVHLHDHISFANSARGRLFWYFWKVQLSLSLCSVSTTTTFCHDLVFSKLWFLVLNRVTSSEAKRLGYWVSRVTRIQDLVILHRKLIIWIM